MRGLEDADLDNVYYSASRNCVLPAQRKNQAQDEVNVTHRSM